MNNFGYTDDDLLTLDFLGGWTNFDWVAKYKNNPTSQSQFSFQMHPYHTRHLFMLFYQSMGIGKVIGFHAMIPGNYDRSTNTDVTVSTLEACIQMVMDLKFHPSSDGISFSFLPV